MGSHLQFICFLYLLYTVYCCLEIYERQNSDIHLIVYFTALRCILQHTIKCIPLFYLSYTSICKQQYTVYNRYKKQLKL